LISERWKGFRLFQRYLKNPGLFLPFAGFSKKARYPPAKMAKSSKPTPKPNQSSATHKQQPAKAAPSPKTEAVNRLERPSTGAPNDPLLRKIFWGVVALAFVVLVGLSFGSGINEDDKFQVDYSQKLVNWYGTFGKDTAALNIPQGNMHLYGGFFEVVTGFANKALGFQPNQLAYHDVRHVGIAICGWVTMLCAALLARLIAGWQAGLFTLIIMLLSPRFVGDSLMNPKDIPFAMGYMLAIYNMAAVLSRMPNPSRWNLAGLVAGLGISLAVRAGGLLNFAYLFMFAGLFLVLKQGFGAVFNIKTLGRYALIVGGAAVGGYVLALLFWPFALQKPLSNPLYALQKFSFFEIAIRVLFDGENVKSDQTPWIYPVKWIAYTVPLAALLGFVGSLALLPRLLRKYQPLWVVLALFAAVFPVVYVIYKKSNLYDGWRQLTFAYPTLAVMAGLFWHELTQFFAEKKPLRYAVYAVFGLLLADAGAFIVRNPQIPYVYFNPIVGGVGGAFGKYETDYWGISIRQGIEWMEQQGILKPDMEEPVVIATNMLFPMRQFTAKYGDKVRLKYLRWEKRCDDAWDYALYPTRFIDGVTLQRGFWPPDNAVHMIRANGAPILAILKDNGRNCALGMAAYKLNDWQGAVDRFQAEVQNVPDNEVAWANLAQSLMNLNRLDSAKVAAEKVLDIAPYDMQASNLIGLYWLNKNDGEKAQAAFEEAIKREPSNPGAWYYLAIIAQVSGDEQLAIRNLDKAIRAAPNFKPAYELAARIYEGQGDMEQAQRIRAAMPK